MNQHGGARCCTALHGTARHTCTVPCTGVACSAVQCREPCKGVHDRVGSVASFRFEAVWGFYGGREAFSAAWECMGRVKASLTTFQPHVGTRQHCHGSHGTARRDTAFSRGPPGSTQTQKPSSAVSMNLNTNVGLLLALVGVLAGGAMII
ncbi:hypothetical protein B0H16DRAFT_1764070 [Mycena metata]|uniref:Uncharacterized protein n=1 Tax=Mycena metata TaxID=1033252 RepID=A0AAD7I6Y2_9AGAR|nr:hypothetical protein B0H16DRAFT_1764070 [Mycena metata]